MHYTLSFRNKLELRWIPNYVGTFNGLRYFVTLKKDLRNSTDNAEGSPSAVSTGFLQRTSSVFKRWLNLRSLTNSVARAREKSSGIGLVWRLLCE